ncbi:MAG: DUF4124 domain-containing protein [Gammaproteobacteria bacterium]|nr:DUF4124 domain-containing protein [Gammaproteobacteria bacterium]
MSKGISIIIGSLLALFISIESHARQIYKWTDADGNIHYGEKPPTNGATQIRIKQRGGIEKVETGKSDQASDKDKRDKMIKAMEADRLSRQEQKQIRLKQQYDRQMRCVRARDTLRRYQDAGSLYRLDPDGKRKTLDNSARQAEIIKMRSNINKWCK